jgi:hypothetical protein
VKESLQDVEHSDQVSLVNFDIGSDAAKELFSIANNGNHRERGFDHHALVAGAFEAQLPAPRTWDVFGTLMA